MKASNLAVLIGLGALLPVATLATTPEQAYLESYHRSSSIPVPVAVVSPHVAPAYAGSTVELEFVVDTSGKPSQFSVKSNTDSALAEAVVAAVKQWQFTPALRDGVPVATRVVLPVHIVDGDEGIRYASN